jgi:hypothetical protein
MGTAKRWNGQHNANQETYPNGAGEMFRRKKHDMRGISGKLRWVSAYELLNLRLCKGPLLDLGALLEKFLFRCGRERHPSVVGFVGATLAFGLVCRPLFLIRFPRLGKLHELAVKPVRRHEMHTFAVKSLTKKRLSKW